MTIYWKTTKESGYQLKLFIFTPKTFSGVVNCLSTSKFPKPFSNGHWNVLHLFLFREGVDNSHSLSVSVVLTTPRTA